ncbi:MAG TPA: MarR family transcriptional regulator [Gaiellaceae bacterium]|nr:MarR family transcriptional regulator [Gaiellaceae bacterium]
MPLAREDVMRVAEFRVALRRFLHAGELTARGCGLTPQRYLLLLLIKGAPDSSESSTVTELAERLHLAQSTVTELVARAEDAGLIERETAEYDGRVANLRLSREGERRLECSFSALRDERSHLREAVQNLLGRV